MKTQMKTQIKTWITKLKPTLVFMAPSLVVGALLGAYPGYRTYEYTWKDADFCISCHVHDYATTGWKNSVHGKLTTCHDCHHQPLRAYIREMYLMVAERPKFPKDLHHIPHVPKDLCEACHLTQPKDTSNITGPLTAQDISQIPKVDRSKLHALHLAQKVKTPLPNAYKLHEGEMPTQVAKSVDHKERPIACVDCHGAAANRAHYVTVADQSCVSCHQPKENSHFIQESGCRNCHFQGFMIPAHSAFAPPPEK